MKPVCPMCGESCRGLFPSRPQPEHYPPGEEPLTGSPRHVTYWSHTYETAPGREQARREAGPVVESPRRQTKQGGSPRILTRPARRR